MGKLIAGIVICTAAGAAIATAAPAWAVPSETPHDQQVYLHETQQITARAQLIYRTPENDAAVEGRAEVIEHSQGLVVYEPAAAPATGKPAVAELQARPASPVHITTTATVSWAPAAALPAPRSF
jgi:hypothetical protein